MANANPIPLSRLKRPPQSWALFGSVLLLLTIAVIGLIISISLGQIATTVIFAAVIGGVGLVLFAANAEKKRLASLDERKFIDWDAAMPEVQRQSVNIEVRELSKLLGVGDDGLSDLLSAYVVAEDLALRQIQQEEQLPLMRHVSIGRVPFDGILIDNDLITCIEVSFLVVPDIRQDKVESVIKKVSQAAKNLAEMKSKLRLRLMLVLVTQLFDEEEDELRGVLTARRFSETPVDIDIRMLDFEMLQRVYVSE
ncbi:MAG: hypothetical protein KF881_13910 [Acidobacteria bacterium]|nr:hypothetical protein [Acidobacteriota bacterium]